MMRIGFDAKRAFMNSSGLGNYARTLMISLLQNFPENHYVAFTPGVEDGLGNELRKSGKLKMIFPPQLFRGILSSFWRSSMMNENISAENLDIFHGLSNELPRRIPRGTKKVVTIHDLIFLRHPEWYPFYDRNVYFKKFRLACREADAVVAVSEQTKQDILYYFNTAAEKVHVVYQGCDAQFFQQAGEDVLGDFRRRYELPERYLLYLGTIEERKNLLVILQAMEKVRDISLVVIGRKKKYFQEVQDFIRANNLEPRIIFPENVSSSELPLFYQAASLFVYPSFYEGFGIPVIEALASGTPVIAAGTTALPEAGGPASVYFNPDDPEELAEKINLVLNDSRLREKLINEGKEYVKKFSQEKLARQLMDLYANLLKG